jgi:hypothetical protein
MWRHGHFRENVMPRNGNGARWRACGLASGLTPLQAIDQSESGARPGSTPSRLDSLPPSARSVA